MTATTRGAATTTTARIVLVCTPADRPIDRLSAAQIPDWATLTADAPRAVFPILHRRLAGWLSRRTARRMAQVTRRFGMVPWAVGDSLGPLDLTAVATAAHAHAGYRWRTWEQVVRDTPTARPWEDFLARHKADPRKVSLDEATHRFEAQPRIVAMLAHNSHPRCLFALDPHELDAFQAGEATYAAVHGQQAVTGPAVITHDGRLLKPASGSLADRLRFLAKASRYLHTLRRGHQILAVTVTTQP